MCTLHISHNLMRCLSMWVGSLFSIRACTTSYWHNVDFVSTGLQIVAEEQPFLKILAPLLVCKNMTTMY